ncbi:uncharacterized protein LOC122576934 [Bombus pyrosoma]|uniref:uncharacterized protein LOC122576934 n=1 Tax=Bombus pyrosoma TaxID=396416 RepID=UPI001CB8B33E|nr:uncharacterized protein LOC122576934 [Bombus pyrosoma]
MVFKGCTLGGPFWIFKQCVFSIIWLFFAIPTLVIVFFIYSHSICVKDTMSEICKFTNLCDGIDHAPASVETILVFVIWILFQIFLNEGFKSILPYLAHRRLDTLEQWKVGISTYIGNIFNKSEGTDISYHITEDFM